MKLLIKKSVYDHEVPPSSFEIHVWDVLSDTWTLVTVSEHRIIWAIFSEDIVRLLQNNKSVILEFLSPSIRAYQPDLDMFG